MKKLLLLSTIKSIFLLGLLFHSGYSMDRQEIGLSDLPNELVTHIIKFCPKENYNNISLVCEEFLDITNKLTEQCRFIELDDDGFLARFKNLTSLNLNDNDHITDEGIQGLTNLTSLSLNVIVKKVPETLLLKL